MSVWRWVVAALRAEDPGFVRHVRRVAVEQEMRAERPRVEVPEERRRHEFRF